MIMIYIELIDIVISDLMSFYKLSGTSYIHPIPTPESVVRLSSTVSGS